MSDTKEEAIIEAIEWQIWSSGRALGFAGVLEWQVYFSTLAEKFGLEEEFKENGIV